MQISLNTSKWWQDAWAALIFFTRLPLWRIYQPPKDSYKAVVEYWPLAGWITGGIMSATIYFGSSFFSPLTVIILAIAIRVLMTGALHEDGLADFVDGFGGGYNKEKTLQIMKDSHIGTYGVIALIFYFMLLFCTLISLPYTISALLVLAADPFCKMISAQLTVMLPYARKEEESKAHVIYRKMSVIAGIRLFLLGITPAIPLVLYLHEHISLEILLFIPCVVLYFLYMMMLRRLKGYTGDCCGAAFLITELSIYIYVDVML